MREETRNQNTKGTKFPEKYEYQEPSDSGRAPDLRENLLQGVEHLLKRHLRPIQQKRSWGLTALAKKGSDGTAVGLWELGRLGKVEKTSADC